MPAKAITKVVTAFRDRNGRDWTPGENWTGSAEEKQAAIAAGQVQEQPAADANE